jgi:hypothetical protein
LPFPLDRRHGQIRRAALALAAARSAAAAERLRFAVADALFAELEAFGLDEAAQDEAVGAFFIALEREMILLGEAEPARLLMV